MSATHDLTNGYYEPVLGSCIAAIHDDGESVWIHLADGGLMQFYAEADGGFNVEITLPEER